VKKGILSGMLALAIAGPALADAPPAATPPPAPGGAGATADTTAGGTDAGLQTGPATIAKHWSKYDYPTTIPEGASYYIIVRGDTLWDISRRFLNSPYLWPQIWNENRYIKDAHWIYPGDPLVIPRVQVVAPAAGQADGVGMGGEETSGEAVAAPTSALIPAIEDMRLQCSGFIEDEPEDESLYIIGSEQGGEKVAFAERDIMYLSKGSSAGVKPGDVYSIRHETYDVKHPDTRKTIGRKVETNGFLRVILVQENSATAIIESSCAETHMGDYLVPFQRQAVPLIVKHTPPDRLTPPSGKAQNGAIIDIQDDAFTAAEGHVLTVNLGARNGIAPGNMLTVYRIIYPSVPTARYIVGEVAIVAVRDKTATARVTYSNDAIMPGDRVELQ